MTDWSEPPFYSARSLIRFTGILLPVLNFLIGAWLAEKLAPGEPVAVLCLMSAATGLVAGFFGGGLLVPGAVGGWVLSIVVHPQPRGEAQVWYFIYFLCLVMMLLIGWGGILMGKGWRDDSK